MEETSWLDPFLDDPALEEALSKEAAIALQHYNHDPPHPAAWAAAALPDLYLPSLADLAPCGPTSSSDFAPLASASEGSDDPAGGRSSSPASSSEVAALAPAPARRRGGRVGAAGTAAPKKRGRPAAAATAAPPKKRAAAPRRRRRASVPSASASPPAGPATHISALPPSALAAIFSAVPLADRRHALPAVCRAWRAVLGGATPAWSHVAVDVEAEVSAPTGVVGAPRATAVAIAGGGGRPPVHPTAATLRSAALHAWLAPRAPALRSLSLTGLPPALARRAGPRHDLTPASLAAVLRLVAPGLEELLLDRAAGLLAGPAWTAVAGLRRLRVLGVRGIREALPGDEELGALAALAPTLRELVLQVDDAADDDDAGAGDEGGGGGSPPLLPAPAPAGGAPADTAVARAAGLGPACKWGLAGFPAGVLHLANLTHLTLSSHLGISALPPEFGARLGGLEQLGLDGCGLGALPPSVGLLTALTSLDLEGNVRLGRAAAAAAARPARLPTPPTAAATGPAPAEAAADPFPLALAGLQSLRHANLNACGLHALPPVLGTWRGLAALDAEANEFGGATPPDAALAALAPLAASLRTLNIAQCGLSALPAGVAALSALSSLDATANAITSDGLPTGLAAMPSLRALGLAGNALATLPRSSLANPGLRSLFLQDNAGLEIDAPLDWVADDLAALRVFRVGGSSPATSWSPASLAHLARLAARLGADGRGDVLRVSCPGEEA